MSARAAAKPPRLVLRAPVAAEDELHEAVASALDRLLKLPAQWTTFPAGHIPLEARWAAKLTRLGLKRNWPDILVLHDGTLHGIELKRPGEKLSRTRFVRTRRGTLRQVEGQRDAFPRLEAAGMRLAVCATADDVFAALDRWGVPTRGRIAA